MTFTPWMKKLPTETELLTMAQDFESLNYKFLMIPQTHWFNSITRCKGIVTDIPILARSNNSDRLAVITSVVLKEPFDRNKHEWENIKEFNSDVDSPLNEQIVCTKRWVFNQYYSHINLSREEHTWTCEIRNNNKSKLLRRYLIRYQSFCSPIACGHLYSKSKEDMALIIKGQFMGQNSDSPFQSVEFVANDYKDKAIHIKDSHTILKRNASIIELLSRQHSSNLRNQTTLNKELRTIMENKDKYFVKKIDNDYYTPLLKEEAKYLEEKGYLSKYYPIITPEQIAELNIEIPKEEIKLACLGLGSAGTGILSQVARSTYCDKYLICDYDAVEAKNLRNQWYTSSFISMSKTEASKRLLTAHRYGTNFNVEKFDCKFQQIPMNYYKFKYTISGFDSIEARLDLLNYVEQGKCETDYIIDTRYDDLASSAFFIKTSDPDQMKYYREGLEQDKAAFDSLEKNNKILSWEEFLDVLEKGACFTCNCAQYRQALQDSLCIPCEYNIHENCKNKNCLAFWKRVYEEQKESLVSKLQDRNLLPKEESSCVKQNFIDIYTYTSSFIFAAMREIENENPKPFTHIECTTDGIPRSMVLKK